MASACTEDATDGQNKSLIFLFEIAIPTDNLFSMFPL